MNVRVKHGVCKIAGTSLVDSCQDQPNLNRVYDLFLKSRPYLECAYAMDDLSWYDNNNKLLICMDLPLSRPLSFGVVWGYSLRRKACETWIRSLSIRNIKSVGRTRRKSFSRFFSVYHIYLYTERFFSASSSSLLLISSFPFLKYIKK